MNTNDQYENRNSPKFASFSKLTTPKSTCETQYIDNIESKNDQNEYESQALNESKTNKSTDGESYTIYTDDLFQP